ncbi:hypothetical protein QN397_24630 [Variovorax sp. RTB1]|uniref:hypothetical protein n=1 Tax=Variovorax sp. RTB1 TaxID=3048631 RepID=UPI002B231827|nr:hypothetical protein [Variovorax sp. RTB1]MEB0114471.1 hypothetical protein [Variovorax sp. RTB1]
MSATHSVAQNSTIQIKNKEHHLLEIIDIQGWRCESNPYPTPEGHWVGLVFRNAYGKHMLELNGRKPLPDHDPQLRSDLEYLLWDYGLLSQQGSETNDERIRVAQELWNTDRNHPKARNYLQSVGAAD